MDASLLSFTGNLVSNGNIAIAALSTQILTTVDSGIASGPNARGPIPIWKSVSRGMGLPSYSEEDPLTILDVRDDQSPACIIFDGVDEHKSTATQWIDTEMISHLRLQFFFNLLGSDAGSYPSVQELRRNMTRATLRTVRPKTIDNPNGMSDPTLINGQFPWWIEEPQSAPANYMNDLNNLFPIFPIVPPWWTWHVNLAIRCTNV